MDLTTVLKDYGTLITAIVGLLGIVLTYFFTKNHYIRSRKWELDDREYKRRVEIHDKRIQEAREYVDNIHDMTLVNSSILYILSASANLEETRNELNETGNDAKRLSTLYTDTTKKGMIISILGDHELNAWNQKVVQELTSLAKYVLKTVLGILQRKCKRIDKKKVAEYIASSKQITIMIACMKQRLDELAISSGKK